MIISDILRHKGDDVATTSPDASIADVIAALAERNVGALVVLDDDAVCGIISERDVVRRLNDHGIDVLDKSVRDLMTCEVLSAAPSDSVDDIATTMTDKHIRHMPVVENDALVGVVSIGDVVSSRIRQLEHDRGQLESYITG